MALRRRPRPLCIRFLPANHRPFSHPGSAFPYALPQRARTAHDRPDTDVSTPR
jgi:hypothetical protein